MKALFPNTILPKTKLEMPHIESIHVISDTSAIQHTMKVHIFTNFTPNRDHFNIAYNGACGTSSK